MARNQPGVRIEFDETVPEFQGFNRPPLTDMVNNLGLAEDDAQLQFFDKVDAYKKRGYQEDEAIQKVFDDNPDNAFGDVSTLKDFYDMYKGRYDTPRGAGLSGLIGSDYMRQKIRDRAIQERDAFARARNIEPNYANLDKVVESRMQLDKEALDNEYQRQIDAIPKPRYTTDWDQGHSYIKPAEYDRYNDAVRKTREMFYGAPMTDEEFSAFKAKYGK